MAPVHRPLLQAARHHRGFSLLEVLVTITITAVALLGAAGLQLRAMQSGQSSQSRTQAVLLAADLAERIEANKAAVSENPDAYTYDSTTSHDPVTDCAAVPCSYAQLAAYDLNVWNAQIPVSLPQATSWTVTTGTNGTGLTTYTIVINWTEHRVNTSYADAGSGEALSYQATRTVY
ncbi:MAG: type IV pilus modification protein PilV [Rhodoferax sp.]|nr:type IV pilus modification protein PilV [Rhodoferax sp.]